MVVRAPRLAPEETEETVEGVLGVETVERARVVLTFVYSTVAS